MSRQPSYRLWQTTGVLLCAMVGLVWALTAHWWVFSFDVPAPAATLAGAVRAITFWPYWLAQLLGKSLPDMAFLRQIWYLPEVLGALAGAAVGAFILVRRG